MQRSVVVLPAVEPNFAKGTTLMSFGTACWDAALTFQQKTGAEAVRCRWWL